MSQKIDLIPDDTKNSTSGSSEVEIVRRILRALANLDYGTVEIVVQDSRVVQIERTQRSRFSQPLDIPKI
jgi:hypothetical protein